MAAHNILISHARAVDAYRKNFQPAQNGVIGITLNCNWTEPTPSDDPEKAKKNAEAAERAVVWNLGWFADPVYTGDYVSSALVTLAAPQLDAHPPPFLPTSPSTSSLHGCCVCSKPHILFRTFRPFLSPR